MFIISYNIRSYESFDLLVTIHTEKQRKRSFSYNGGMLWNNLPDGIKESNTLGVSKRNYRFINVWSVSSHIKV